MSAGLTLDRDLRGVQPEETPEQRINRNLLEMLNELRVAMPGVQVLFGFLLAVPFQQRFDQVDEFQRMTYFVTLLCAALATACFVAVSAFHRLVFRQGERPAIVKYGNRMAISGLICLALAMNGAVLLVTDILFQAPVPLAVGLAMASVYGWLWFGVGLSRRIRNAQRAG
jgi:uncharacterized protein DUF6328